MEIFLRDQISLEKLAFSQKLREFMNIQGARTYEHKWDQQGSHNFDLDSLHTLSQSGSEKSIFIAPKIVELNKLVNAEQNPSYQLPKVADPPKKYLQID